MESHEAVPCVPLWPYRHLYVLRATSGLQASWEHPLMESAAVSTAPDRCRISTHIWPPPQDGQPPSKWHQRLSLVLLATAFSLCPKAQVSLTVSHPLR